MANDWVSDLRASAREPINSKPAESWGSIDPIVDESWENKDPVVAESPEHLDLEADKTAGEAIALINQYAAGDISLTPEQLRKSLEVAKAGKGAWSRAGDWLKRLYFTPIGDVADAVGKFASSTAGQFGNVIDSAIEGAASTGQAPSPSDAIETGKKLSVGGAKTAVSVIPMIGGVANEVSDLAAQPLGIDMSKEDAGFYQFQHDMNQAVNAASEAMGVKKDDPIAGAGELIAGAMLPGGAEAKASKTIAKGAEALVEGGTKLAGRTAQGIAATARTVGPAVAAGAELYHGHPWIALATLAGGYAPSRYGWIGAIKHAIVDKGIGGVETLGRAAADAPWGTTVMKSVQDGLVADASKIEERIAQMRAGADPKKLERLDATASDGSLLYDVDHLPKEAKEIRLEQEKLQDLKNNIQGLDKYVTANRVLSDGTKYVLRSAGNAAVAATTGAAITSSTAAPEDAQRELEGVGMGLFFGAPAVHKMASEGKLRMYADEMVKAGKDFVSPDNPDYSIHKESIDALGPQADSVYKIQALAKPFGTKVIVLSPEEALARSTGGKMPPTEGQAAPNGWFDRDSNTIYVNRDAIQSGVAGHELTHSLQQALGFNVINGEGATPEMEALRQQFNDLYTQALNRTKKSGSLDEDQINSELEAELGRDILQSNGPEAFYGGKSGGKLMGEALKRGLDRVLKRNVGEIQQKIETQGPFQAPATAGQRQELSSILYDIGERARRDRENKPPQTPQKTVDASEPLGSVNIPEATPERATGLQNEPLFKDTVAALKKLGVTDPEAKAQSAYNELITENGDAVPTLEELVKRSTQKAVPESFMPSSHPEAIVAPAIKTRDGDIIRGVNHPDARIKIGSTKAEGAVDGFVTRDDRFLNRDEALAHARAIGQIPKSAADYIASSRDPQLDTEDLSIYDRKFAKGLEASAFREARKFMPSSSNDTLQGPAIQTEDGITIRGGTHDMAIKEADRLGLEVQNAKLGFTTKLGHFLEQGTNGKDDALKWGQEIGQLPEDMTQLTDHDFNGVQTMQFMPSDNPDALERTALKRKSDGKVFTGSNPRTPHWMIPNEHEGIRDYFGLDGHKNWVDGWVDRQGNFLDKEQGYKRAIETKQLPENVSTEYKGALSSLDAKQAQFMPSSTPDSSLEAAIHDYTKKAGIDYIPYNKNRAIDETYAKKIADIYQELKHNPSDPEVLKSYDAFRDGILGQYKELTAHGYKIEPWMKEGQPYANSDEMLKDLRENKHIYYFRTDSGYGQDKGGSTPVQHPMLRGSGIFFNGKEAVINDIFRGVHDALGHGTYGHQFGPRGEYNAFLTHASTLPKESWPALATETIGQNSWTNFGPHMRDATGRIYKKGEEGYIPQPDRPFTEQRANLLHEAARHADEVINGQQFMPSAREVSQSEFDAISKRGKDKLAGLREAKSPTIGLDKNWPTIVDSAYDEVKKPWGGAAIDSHTGEIKVGPIGDGQGIGDGPYSVTAKEPHQETIEIPETASKQEFEQALSQARDQFPQLEYQDHHLSVFHDNDKGTIDIDPTILVGNLKDAEDIGAYTRNVGGIYDFDSGNGHWPPVVAKKGLSDVNPAMPETPKEGLSKLNPEDRLNAIEVGEPAWSIRLRELNNKERNQGLTDAEEKESLDLYNRAKKDYGSYEKWFNKFEEKNYTGDVFKNVDRDKLGGQFMPSARLTKEAEGLHLEYKGDMDYGGKVVHLYNDPITKSTITVKQDAPAGTLQAKLRATREKFLNPDRLSFMPSDNKDAIKEAALRTKDGEMFTGSTHGEAFSKAIEKYMDENGPESNLAAWRKYENAEDGYIDGNTPPNFYDRNAAKEQAKKIGQVTEGGLKKANDYYGGLEGGSGLESLNFARARKFMPASKNEGFYSQLERHLEDKMPNKANPDQLAGILKGGAVKKSELEWSGINDLIESAKKEGRQVTKQEALDWVRANTPEVTERILGEKPMGLSPAEQREYEDLNDTPFHQRTRDHQDRLNELYNRNIDRRQDTKYSQYQLPGGENYRELLYTLPQKGIPLPPDTIIRPSSLGFEIAEESSGKLRTQRRFATEDEARQWISRDSNASPSFKTDHFPNEPNVLAHTRVNDRTLPDNSKMLFAEELQSDWAQQGRKEGFASDFKPEAYKVDDKWVVDMPSGEQVVRDSKTKAESDAKGLVTELSSKVPDMPFKGEGWKKLLLRNLIRHAVEEGYDSVGWTTGEQQASRYDLSQHISKLTAHRNNDGTFDIDALTNDSPTELKSLATRISPDELDKYVGKDLAQKIVNNEGRSFANGLAQSFDGLDLKVGGEGMKGFYDKELVNIANDIGKKYGAKVEQVEIPTTQERYYIDESTPGQYIVRDRETGKAVDSTDDINDTDALLREYQEKNDKNVTVHSLKITPEMRQSIAENGQPLFMPSPISEARGMGAIPHESDEMFWKKAWPDALKSTGLQVSPKNEKAINKAASKAVEDVHKFLNENPRFADYYNRDWNETKAALDQHYGRPLTNDELTFFKMAKGLTSPNTALEINVADAMRVTDQWLKDGNLDSIKMGISPRGNRVLSESPVSISGTTNAIKAFSLKAIDKLSQDLGGPEKAAEYLREPVSVQELQDFNKSLGFKGGVGKLGSIKELVEQATGQSDKIPRMFVFGRKVGAYTLNLLGDHSYNTVDIWESRFIRSQFKGMFKEGTGLPTNVEEHKLFSRFSELFNEEFRKQTGMNLDTSALQAARWFYMLDSAKRAGYQGTTTGETISHYVNKFIRSKSEKGGGLGEVEAPQGAEEETSQGPPINRAPESGSRRLAEIDQPFMPTSDNDSGKWSALAANLKLRRNLESAMTPASHIGSRGGYGRPYNSQQENARLLEVSRENHRNFSNSLRESLGITSDEQHLAKIEALKKEEAELWTALGRDPESDPTPRSADDLSVVNVPTPSERRKKLSDL